MSFRLWTETSRGNMFGGIKNPFLQSVIEMTN